MTDNDFAPVYESMYQLRAGEFAERFPAESVAPGVALLCHGGHITLHAAPAEGLCFVDVAGLGGTHPQRGLDVIIKRCIVFRLQP